MDGHAYRMACEEGDEDRVTSLATELDTTIRQLKAKTGEIGDRRISVMAGLVVLDRLRAAEEKNAELAAHIAALERAREAAALASEGEDEPLIERLDAATDAVERMTRMLNDQIHAASEEVSHAGHVSATFGRAPEGATDTAAFGERRVERRAERQEPRLSEPPRVATSTVAATAAMEAGDAPSPPVGAHPSAADDGTSRIEPHFGGHEDDDDDDGGDMIPSFMQPT
ncbi:cell division protein ZapA [Acuticoccus kalidii]|uniref:cell division protein ZapA n=1 Tax=Acuticoccus kalidii TaxID=2910977 RepID=UPI0034E1E756